MIEAFLPKPEVKGEGDVVYRCFICDELIEGEQPLFLPPLPLTPETQTFHQEHAPDGR